MARLLIATFLLALTTQGPPGNREHGARLFDDQCGDCHSASAGAGNRRGPNLFGVFGRRAGSLAEFKYSDANRHSGVVWDSATLDRYLVNPRGFMPGTGMRFKGLDDPADRRDVIAFLEQLK